MDEVHGAGVFGHSRTVAHGCRGCGSIANLGPGSVDLVHGRFPIAPLGRGPGRRSGRRHDERHAAMRGSSRLARRYPRRV